jgi:hypothetical protein
MTWRVNEGVVYLPGASRYTGLPLPSPVVVVVVVVVVAHLRPPVCCLLFPSCIVGLIFSLNIK